ncbi:polysaccharide pyruvyl transferase family protein [Agathobacter rectalis]|uniref:Polysaccharide pyruvyl transferase family protein n=1 Tax=Agathobacter rectalis TaxID=39491 RepID=A0A414ITZ2_9FIRM|nr:polysaccharide pyruvyl transferase family protein [Agathobacter rectalis]RGT11868.1 polysaccharide pyruvyl transferase family protein [Agathobacter rectalis]RGT18355.1 polysaccharide pyruvyl transferase family protein [Agathobacter rectalis]RHE32104.1 polysaccharide pyruvyl transferase family protein [Agathobacter rectalis]
MNSKKIGIITWFTGPNYGTNLQAIALQYYLRKQGYEVNIINYEVPYLRQTKTIKKLIRKVIYQPKELVKKYALKLVYQPKNWIVKYALNKYRNEIEERDNKLTVAIQKNCVLTSKVRNLNELINICNSYDLLICGSDQIWNPNWYNRFYFADYDEITTRRIAYAPSMGVNAISDTVIPDIKRSISKFDYVSVRENKAADLLEACTGRRPTVVVDPTFLLSKEEWECIFELEKTEDQDYILAFFLNDEYNHLKATRKFAKRNSCRLILIPYKGMTYLQSADICADAGLEDMLRLIKNAKYVVTDSFHITVFSIIFNKQFFTFQRFKDDAFTSQNVRVINLLELTGLEGRLIPFRSKNIVDIDNIIYSECMIKLDNEIKNSKKYLKTAVEQSNEN